MWPRVLGLAVVQVNFIVNARGTITNVNGDFVLEMKDPDNTIRISVIGYETKEIPADATKVLAITLAPSNVELEEVTVTAAAQPYQHR